MKKVTFEAPYLNIRGYAIQKTDEDPIEAVARSLERRTGMRCYCHRSDGYTDSYYIERMTLVHRQPVTGGGYCVYAEPRVYIDRN